MARSCQADAGEEDAVMEKFTREIEEGAMMEKITRETKEGVRGLGRERVGEKRLSLFCPLTFEQCELKGKREGETEKEWRGRRERSLLLSLTCAQVRTERRGDEERNSLPPLIYVRTQEKRKRSTEEVEESGLEIYVTRHERERRKNKKERGEKPCASPCASLYDDFFSVTRERYTKVRKERRALLLPLTRERDRELQGRERTSLSSLFLFSFLFFL